MENNETPIEILKETPAPITSPLNQWAIPLSIIIAGALIAGAVYLTNKGAPVSAGPATATSTQVTIKPITSADHIFGNPEAKISIVEYSDTECPYCQAMMPILHQIITNYNGQVNWVYRHFTIHSKAPYEAEATECVNELAGNNTFWTYLDAIFSHTKADNNLDPAYLTTEAVALGVNQTKFQACLASGKYASLVAQETQDAEAAGGQGTPYIIIVAKSGLYPINGAIPYTELKSVIDSLLAQNK